MVEGNINDVDAAAGDGIEMDSNVSSQTIYEQEARYYLTKTTI